MDSNPRDFPHPDVYPQDIYPSDISPFDVNPPDVYHPGVWPHKSLPPDFYAFLFLNQTYPIY